MRHEDGSWSGLPTVDVTDEYLDLLGMRLERVLEGNHNGR